MKATLNATIDAYQRGEERLRELQTQWVAAGGLCCPGCMFPREWLNLVQKQERRMAFINHASAYIEKHGGTDA